MFAYSSSSSNKMSSRSSHVLTRPFFLKSWSISSYLDFSPDLGIQTWNVQAFCTHRKLWSFCLYPFFFTGHSSWEVSPLGPTLFLHILWILREIKASSYSSNSSSNSSLDESSTLSALDELLKICSLENDAFLFFWLLRARDFCLLNPSSYWISCSWTSRIPTSSLRGIESRFFKALNVVTCNLQFLDRLLKILSMWS